MKRLFFALQFPLFVAFNFFILTAVLDFNRNEEVAVNYNHSMPTYNGQEDFNPALLRINSISKLERYCDSVYAVKYATQPDVNFEESYPGIVTAAVRDRFYHGYSNYSFKNNLPAVLFEPLTGKNMSAIVLPDDILKYPYGACSQQSIVVMELLRKKGLLTRVVGFNGKMGGHFSFETYYNGTWHFFDPNMEPDQAVLNKYNQPGIAFLASNPSILLAAYKNIPTEKTLDLFLNYSYGKPNATVAPWATPYQKVTKFLSYTLWIFFLMAFIWTRRKYHRLRSIQHVRNSRIHLPQLQPTTSPAYNVGY